MMIIITIIGDTSRSPNLGQTTRLSDSHKRKKTCRILDFAVLTNSRVKMKEREKRDMYLDLAQKQKPKKSYGIVIGEFRAILKDV